MAKRNKKINLNKNFNGIKSILKIALAVIIVFTQIEFPLRIEANNTTIVDVTGLASGAEASHDCSLYLVNSWDETYHWGECSICGKTYNKASHSFVDNGWTMGSASASCSESNVHKYTCDCGYSYSTSSGRKSHTKGSGGNNTSGYWYGVQCSNCTYYFTFQYCQKSDGTLINCANLGKCSLCGYTYSTSNANHLCTVNLTTGEVRCRVCNAYIGTGNSYITNTATGTNVLTLLFTPISGATYSSVSGYVQPLPNYTTSTSISRSSTPWRATLTSKNKYYTETYSGITKDLSIWVKYNGMIYRISGTYNDNYKSENNPPVITSITQNQIATSNGYATSNEITISGTEDYCSTVSLTLKDKEGNVYLDNISVSVASKAWSYTFIPDIEANEETTFIVTAKDTLDNISSKEFVVSKTDRKAPTIISPNSTSNDWTTSKDMTISATDEGIGDVQISFNNQETYALGEQDGTTYSRNYTFIGDVYGDTQAAIYCKDALGNISTQFITISNIDNTSPTITNIDIVKGEETSTITIGANDINTTLNASGSGIVAYALVKEGETPNDDDWQESNVFEVSNNGKYIAYARDLVGNIGSSNTSYELYFTRSIIVTTNWNDDNNSNSLRPDTYIIKLYQNGELYETKELDEGTMSYTFENIPTYDEDGNKYTYIYEIDAGERYLVEDDENGGKILTYQESSFSVIIPKTIVLDGESCQATSEIEVSGTLYCNDHVDVIPDKSFTMNDKYNIRNINVTIAQSQTTFTKDTMGKSEYTIKTSTSNIAGEWSGTFNYSITLTISN